VSKVAYQARFLNHAYLERERNTDLAIGLYEDGALVAPSGGEVSIYNASGVAVVNAAAVVVSGSRATYALSSSTVSAESYGSGWRVEWSLTMPDGEVHGLRQNASLVRFLLYPVITDADLYRRHTDLASHLVGTGLTSYEGYIQEAWIEVESRLEMQGRRPFLVMSPEAMRSPHLYGTLKLICRDFAGTGSPDNKWAVLADHYDSEEMKSWADLNFIYDEDNTGEADGVSRTDAKPTLWLGS
jgi:hypothetical protein